STPSPSISVTKPTSSIIDEPANLPSISNNEKPHSPSSFFSGSLNVYLSVSNSSPSYDSTLSITLSRVTSSFSSSSSISLDLFSSLFVPSTILTTLSISSSAASYNFSSFQS